MIILVVLFWFISYTAGIICLTLAAIACRRRPDQEMKSFLFLFAAMSAAVIPLTLKSAIEVSNLLWTLRSVHYETLIVSLTVISQSAICLLSAAFILYSHARQQRGYRPLDRIVLRASAAIGLILAVDVVLFSMTGAKPFGIISVWISIFIVIVFPLTVLYAIVSVLQSKQAPNGKTGLTLCFGGLVLILTLLWRDIPGTVPAPLLNHYLLPGTYLLISVVLLTGLIRRLLAPAGPELNKTLLEDLHISPREREVITHLLTGASYKEIGGLLHISLPTVQTHISRIYQKAAVRSKVELLRLLTGN